jgi:malate synthase
VRQAVLIPKIHSDVVIKGPIASGYEQILSPEAVAFLAELARSFTGRLDELLKGRRLFQERTSRGQKPDFLAETSSVRRSDWTVAPIPPDLRDRRVEITGPVDRKMIINALNSGANVFMADFEDSNSPTWDNLIQGQINLRDAVRRTISYIDPSTGKTYSLNEKTAVLMVRPRGWHLWEKHLTVAGEPVPAGLFDFGLFLFHNARALLERGTRPYFYLPKMQSHLEARLWNDVFVKSQDALGIPRGTIRATVLIETLPAAFQMDEILYELREHSAGLNCGRWDYIFSFIKTFRDDPSFVLPDRGQVTMEQHFLKSYTQLLIKTCHRRGIHAMGGMAAQIPIKNDPEANAKAVEKVRADKLREVKDGHDGTWIAHPGLVQTAKDVFDAHMPAPNQIGNSRADVNVTSADLLEVPTGTRTEAGLRQNVNVGIQYLEAWLRGQGCVPLYNLMEDAATAEISRTQIWQWKRHAALLEDGRPVAATFIQTIIDEEMERIRAQIGGERFRQGRFTEAREIFESLSSGDDFVDFLTLPAYETLLKNPRAQEE